MNNQEVRQTRRGFLKNFALVGVLALSVLGFLRNVILYLFPPSRKKKFHKYLVSKEGEIPVGKAKKITIGRKPVYVVHLPTGYKVLSGICTHLGCIIRWEEQKNRFFCPCHKGVYRSDGTVVSGPPPRPLDEFQVKIEKDLVFIYVEEKIRGPWA